VLQVASQLAAAQLVTAPVRAAMTVLGCALGVGLVFAMNVVGASVSTSFSRSVDGLAGRASWSLGDGGGVDEALLEHVRAVRGVLRALPTIEEQVQHAGDRRSLMLLAFDTLSDERLHAGGAGPELGFDPLVFLNDPLGVLIGESLARELGVSVGDAIPCHTSAGLLALTVHGLLPSSPLLRALGGHVLVMDVYAAQLSLGRGAHFDRIDVIADTQADTEGLGEALRKASAGRATVSRSHQRSQEADQLVAGFRLGVGLTSFVAMLGSAFIVYNAMSVSVARRKRELGVLRALGAGRGQVLVLVLLEGGLVGLLGTGLGVALGLLLGEQVLALAGQAIDQLGGTVPHDTPRFTPSPASLLLALGIGVGTSLLASALPAWRAGQVEPITALRTHTPELTARPGSASSWLALVSASVAFCCALLARSARSSVWAACAALLLVLAGTLLAPSVVSLVARTAERALRHGPPGLRLGADNFRRNAVRNAVAVAALGIALGNVVNIGCFLSSLKRGTSEWFERTLRADVLVLGGAGVQATFAHQFPEALAERVAALPEVEFVNTLRVVRHTYAGKPFHLAAHDMERASRYDEVPVVAGDLAEALPAITRGEAVAVSETFAQTFGTQLGDTLALDTPSGPASFRVALVYVDYGSNLGIVALSRAAYVQRWGDHRLDALWVYARPHTPTEDLDRRIARVLGHEHTLTVLPNGSFKRSAMAVFDRSFALTRALEVVSLLVALLGVGNALAVSVLDRVRELGVLRALGASRSQVSGIFMVEALLIGGASALLGAGTGLATSVYVVHEMLRLELGWRIAWHGSPWIVLEMGTAALLVAAAASLFPVRTALRSDPQSALSLP
jgi:putative ABC transport system permease protein